MKLMRKQLFKKPSFPMTNPLPKVIAAPRSTATWLTLEPESQRATLGGCKGLAPSYLYIYICIYVIFQEYSNEWQLLPEQFAMFQSLKVNRFESHS